MLLSLQHSHILRPVQPRGHFTSVFWRSSGHNLNDGDLRLDFLRRSIHIQSKSSSDNTEGVRLSTLLQKHLGLSRRQSERMILSERITLYGKVVKSPTFEIPRSDKTDQIAIKVDGRLVHGAGSTLQLLQKEYQRDAIINNTQLDEHLRAKRDATVAKDSALNPRVWLCNKLKGELITEDDPDGRPSMLQRLIRGGVGENTKKQSNHLPTHLKPVGRLDMMTEGLMIFTNDGQYARALELPVNQLWRTYRVRVHGRLTMGKMNSMRKGVTVRIDDDINKKEDKAASGEVVKSAPKIVKYKGIKVSIERKSLSLSNRRRRGGLGQVFSGGTNTWLQITCTEGKNRMLVSSWTTVTLCLQLDTYMSTF
eukprot:CCRYP_016338-RA/>CCRYP_016338-RA protein AED:0.00 eAED:0.00 QI:25/-1/1/1/-1/1/1/414/365